MSTNKDELRESLLDELVGVALAEISLDESKQPKWHNAVEADEALGKAYRALVDLKLSIDKFHEIPNTLMPFYNGVNKAMGEVGKLRQDVYNLRMQTKRLARGW